MVVRASEPVAAACALRGSRVSATTVAMDSKITVRQAPDLKLASDIGECMGGVVEQAESAAVSFFQIVASKDTLSRAGGDDAHIEQHRPVEVLSDRGEIVMHDQAGFATRSCRW